LKLALEKTRRFNFYLTLGRKLIVLIPYGWSFIFLFVPFLIILKISLSEPQTAIPPYMNIAEWLDNYRLKIMLNFENYTLLLHNKFYLKSFLKSVKIASISTFFCLILAYPMAYFIARADREIRILLLLLIILPFWTSFLIRVYAWIGLLNGSGIINSFLLWLKIIDSPLPLINNDFSVCLGIVYSYLPFMILPLYVAIEKIEPTLLEAAYDLGCRPLMAFLKITLPLSMPGIITGSMIVFIPAMGETVYSSFTRGD
jgi:putrescine transport system permease protein